MASRKSATPLVAINAVAIDTETTSLDTNKARFVQMGAVRLKNGRLLETDVFDTLVNPQEGIPDVSTRVHGITNADVRLARTFKEMHGEFERFVGQEIVIGHSVGFDLAIWRNEARRAGVEWPAPRALDTRLLAEIANPRLPGFSLEIVTAWLGIEEKNRHSALGDALARSSPTRWKNRCARAGWSRCAPHRVNEASPRSTATPTDTASRT